MAADDTGSQDAGGVRRSSLWERTFGSSSPTPAAATEAEAAALAGVRGLEARLCDAFESVDLDHDGRLSKRELYRAFARLGLKVTAGEELRFWRAIDGDGNGRVDWREFRRAGLALHSLGELTATAPQPGADALGCSSTSVASTSPSSSLRSPALSSPLSAPRNQLPLSPKHTAFARRDYQEEGRVRGAASSLAALEGRARRSSAKLMRDAYRAFKE